MATDETMRRIVDDALAVLDDEEVARVAASLLSSRNIPHLVWSWQDVADIIRERIDGGDLPNMDDAAIEKGAKAIWPGGLAGLSECSDGDWDVIRSAVDRHYKINGHENDTDWATLPTD